MQASSKPATGDRRHPGPIEMCAGRRVQGAEESPHRVPTAGPLVIRCVLRSVIPNAIWLAPLRRPHRPGGKPNGVACCDPVECPIGSAFTPGSPHGPPMPSPRRAGPETRRIDGAVYRRRASTIQRGSDSTSRFCRPTDACSQGQAQELVTRERSQKSAAQSVFAVALG